MVTYFTLRLLLLPLPLLLAFARRGLCVQERYVDGIYCFTYGNVFNFNNNPSFKHCKRFLVFTNIYVPKYYKCENIYISIGTSMPRIVSSNAF